MRLQRSLFLGLFFMGLMVLIIRADFRRDRDGKLLGLFQVVKFPNNVCEGSDRNGTCYTASECSAKGGTNAGSCASGYGVCCTFSISCGSISSENCTYIDNNSPTTGSCQHTICPCRDDICQLRLDFETFVIAGPSMNSLSETKILNGSPNAGGQANSLASQCLTDAFSVTNSGGNGPAPICGINSGQHMYVDVINSPNGGGCNGLNFHLGFSPVSTFIPNRQWSIKVSQIACDSPVRAPDGCTQYFLNNVDTVKTFNFDGGQHLAYQKQSICVRRNKGQCRICWSAVTPEDFAVSGTQMTASKSMGKGFTTGSICCGYNDNGINEKGYDCLQIPGAVTSGSSKYLILNSRFCGRSVGLVKSNGLTDAASSNAHITICSTQTPFVIRFISDGFEEEVTEIVKPNKGFQLAYEQDDQNCP